MEILKSVLISIAVFVVLSAILGVLLGICSKVFHVENDPRIDEVTKLLPGANCGGCGHPGCAGMAAAVVEQGADPGRCKPCKRDRVEEIKEYLKKHTGPNGEYIE